MSSEQFFRTGRSERAGSNQPFDGRGRVEHRIEDDQIERAGFADLEADNGHRVALVLEVDRRFVGKVDLLVKSEKIVPVSAEVLAHGQQEALVCR